jgi:hypothetical protein
MSFDQADEHAILQVGLLAKSKLPTHIKKNKQIMFVLVLNTKKPDWEISDILIVPKNGEGVEKSI